jgi:predicted  nucleic acid-binding Zn-ribbon protein
MDPPTELARSPGVDSKRHRLSTGYLPIAFAAVVCAVAITIAFETRDLPNQRSAWERSKSAREKMVADNSLMNHALIHRRRELTSIESKEEYHQQILSVAQHELEKAQRHRVDASQEMDKAVRQEPKVGVSHATIQKQIEALRDQFENARKRLSILRDKLMRVQDRSASLDDRRAKLNMALPKMAIDETRLRGAAKWLEDEVRSATKRRDAIAFRINSIQGQLRQLELSPVGQMRGTDDPKRLADDVKRRSERMRMDVIELDRKRAALVPQTRVSAVIPVPDWSNQEEQRREELTSKDAELDAKRVELEQNIKVLQQQKDELEKTNKSIQDQLDAAAANLASVTDQVKTLEPDRRESATLQAQLEELNRQLDERRKMIGRPTKPAPRSRAVQPAPLGSTEAPLRGAR